MGKNDNGKFYNDIELICRNPEKLEQFRDNAPNIGTTQSILEQSASSDWHLQDLGI